MIAVVGIVKNEIDIIELSLRHMLAEEIDHIYLADGCSTDGTREIIEDIARSTGRITVLTDDDEYVQQAAWTNRLAAIAADDGADWIVANDIDEFFYSVDGQTVAARLRGLDASITKLYARSYQHLDWDTRQVKPKRLPKVIYRWSEGAEVTTGNHDVNLPGGEYDIIDLREIQYRSVEHFICKARAGVACLDATARSNGYGWHHLRLDGMNDEQLRSEWDAMCAIPTVFDPIPSHLL